MSIARRRLVVALALTVLAGLALTAGAGSASAGLWRAPAVTFSTAASVSTTFGHSTVIPVAVEGNPTGAGARLRWCVVPAGEATCWASEGSVPVPAGASTVWTRPLSPGRLMTGTNRVHLWYTDEHVTGTRGLSAEQTRRDGLPSVHTAVRVRAEAPQLTVSLSRKTVAARDVARKRVNVYAYASVTGVSQSVTRGTMALYVDGRRVSAWTPLRSLPIPGSTNKKPAMQTDVPTSALRSRGTHTVQVRYRAEGPAAVAVGTGEHTSLRRSLRVQ